METDFEIEVVEKKELKHLIKILVTGERGTKTIKDQLDNLGYSVDFFPLDEGFSEDKLPFTIKHLKPAFEYGLENGHDIVLGVDESQQKLSVAIRKEIGGSFVLLNIHQLSAILLQRWLASDRAANLVCLKSLHISEMVDHMVVKSEYKCHSNMIPEGMLLEVAKSIKLNVGEEYLVGFNEDQQVYHSELDLLEIIQELVAIEAVQRENEKTIFDLLIHLYSQFGFYKEKTIAIDFNTPNQRKHLLGTMDDVRKNPKILNGRYPIESITDHFKGKKKNILTGKVYNFPPESFNVLKVEFPENFSLTFAPTDSKMYYFTSMRVGVTTKEQYEARNKEMDKEILKFIQTIIKG